MGCGDSSLKNFDSFVKSVNDNKYKQIIVITGNLVSQKVGVPNILPMRTAEQSAKVISYDPTVNLLEPVNYDIVPHYKDDHVPFYEMYRTLINRQFTPNSVHMLVSELNKRGVLLVNLTTNIDGLAIQAGVTEGRVHEINGNYRSAECIECWEKDDIDYFNQTAASSESACSCRQDGCQGKLKPSLHFGKQPMDRKFSYTPMLLGKADLILMIGVNPQLLVHFLQKKPEKTPLVIFNPIKHTISPNLLIEGHPEDICEEVLKVLSPKSIQYLDNSEQNPLN